jgi:hypothetical protein
MDLGGWLRSLGLEQYEAAFRENAIDPTILLRLTEDLKDLGVGTRGSFGRGFFVHGQTVNSWSRSLRSCGHFCGHLDLERHWTRFVLLARGP